MANNDRRPPVDSMNFLYDIMNDLYGGKGRTGMTREDLDRAREAVEADFAALAAEKPPVPASVAAAVSAAKAEPAQPAPVEPEAPQLPPFDSFWRTADESVDWTDALVRREPNDGLTDPELWRFYHEQAERVLNGDLTAYVAVLKKANPLGDLLPYARGFHVKADSADTLSVTFEALGELLTGDEQENRVYLAGISLRAARDLLALLPVCEVVVKVEAYGVPALNVTYARHEVQKVRFALVEPVSFCISCGGVFC